jgi:hypothetical protein
MLRCAEMTDAEEYTKDFNRMMAEPEAREREHQEKELGKRVEDLRRRGLAVKPRLTLPEMQRIIDSGYGIAETEQIIWDREHPDD